jgi:hypothetical protein
VDCLKFPISYDSSGFTKLVDGSTDYYKQLLSICARTEPGVSPLFPDFGVYDPTLMIADKGQFIINAARYVPEIQIEQIESILGLDGSTAISFTFSRRA